MRFTTNCWLGAQNRGVNGPWRIGSAASDLEGNPFRRHVAESCMGRGYVADLSAENM